MPGRGVGWPGSGLFGGLTVVQTAPRLDSGLLAWQHPSQTTFPRPGEKLESETERNRG